MDKKEGSKRTAERVQVSRDIEFFVDADIIKAESVDLSKSGIRMVTSKPIQIRMRMYEQAGYEEYVAELVWATRSDGSMVYGFEFTEDPEST